MQPKFVANSQLSAFLEAVLAGREVFGTRKLDANVRFARLSAGQIEIAPHRAVDPAKSFFFRLRQDVGGYFDGSPDAAGGSFAIVGVAACDLAALNLLDAVFLQGDFVDPFYQAARRNTLIVTVDCTEPKDVCFCAALGAKPYCESGYDLNLSPADGGCVVDAGSATGKDLLERHGRGLPDGTPGQLGSVTRRRTLTADKAKKSVSSVVPDVGKSLQERLRDSRDPIWTTLADKCVECAACNFVCPTCHCFLLTDVNDAPGFRRYRNWDSCQYAAFAREASGANPRARRAERLHGRLEKKFCFIKDSFGVWGCVGCGRCIEACAGKIDLRETLRELANAESLQSH